MPDNPPVQRKLAAILAADVAGYSRLMGADEEGTLDAPQSAPPRADRPEDRRAPRPHRQDHRRRPPGRVRRASSTRCAARSRCKRGMAERNAARAETRASSSASASISATSSSRTATSSATASMSPRGSKRWPSRAASASRRAVHDQMRGKLDFAFDDLGEQALKNIARPVHVYRRAARRQRATCPIIPALPLPDKPSIAVLPFQNMSGDPEQEYFADGMVEEIITALSRIRWLFVIARNSSFTYKGQAVDVKQVGRELGRALCARRLGAQGRQPGAHHRAADRRRDRHASLGRPLRRLARRRLRPSGQGRAQRRRRHRAGIASRRDAPLGRAADDRPHRLRSLPARACGLLSGNERADFRGSGIARAGDRDRSALRAGTVLGGDLPPAARH